MNTDSFKEQANILACKTENDMRAICNMGRTATPGTTVIPGAPTLAPLTPEEYKIMQTLLAIQGRDGFTELQRAALAALVKRYMANGGSDPYNAPVPEEPGGPGTTPTGSSFATHSIDNIWDLLNFLKASGIILMGASSNPSFIIPANIIVFVSFIYATRKSIFKFSIR